jgi:hypothetical protein
MAAVWTGLFDDEASGSWRVSGETPVYCNDRPLEVEVIVPAEAGITGSSVQS